MSTVRFILVVDIILMSFFTCSLPTWSSLLVMLESITGGFCSARSFAHSFLGIQFIGVSDTKRHQHADLLTHVCADVLVLTNERLTKVLTDHWRRQTDELLEQARQADEGVVAARASVEELIFQHESQWQASRDRLCRTTAILITPCHCVLGMAVAMPGTKPEVYYAVFRRHTIPLQRSSADCCWCPRALLLNSGQWERSAINCSRVLRAALLCDRLLLSAFRTLVLISVDEKRNRRSSVCLPWCCAYV